MFNEFILSDMVRTLPELIRYYARHALANDHEIVFTHGDLAPRDILVDEGGHVTAILDWESGGWWYPEYWEYTKAFAVLRPMKDWPEYLPHILPLQYEKEYIGLRWLILLLSH